MTVITKDTVIGTLLDLDPSVAPYFLEIGMHCLVHGTDADQLVAKLNAHFGNE